MSELKLRRVIEHNQRLREDLARPRVRVSEASARCVVMPVEQAEILTLDLCDRSLIRYCKTTKDHLVPSVWGPVGRAEDPYGAQTKGCQCSVQ